MGGGKAVSARSDERPAWPVHEIPGAASGFFRLSPAERAERHGAFGVRRGEIGWRLDPHFHFAEFADAIDRIKVVNHRTLGEILPPSGETWTPADDETHFHYIEIGAVGIGNDSYEPLQLRVEQAPSRARLLVRRGDILVSTTRPDRGAIARVRTEHDGYVASTGFAVLRAVDPSTRDILFETLQTELVRLQLRQRSTGGAYPAITIEELAQIQLPLVDDSCARALLADLDAARTARDARLAAASDLLAGIDAVVLDALGLELPPPHDPTRPFAVRFERLVAGGKLIPSYYHPDRLHATDAIRSTGSFDEISGVATLERSQRTILPEDFYVGLARVASSTGELTDAEESVEGAVVTFAPGDVLFARLRPYLNKVWVADREGVASPEFYVLRPNANVSPEYLGGILRSSLILAQTRHLMTGNTHPRVGPEDFQAILVPLGDEAIRSTIASEIDRRRTEARQLREEARVIWESARSRFEERLLGPAA